jgi:hypothetical protein
MVIEASHCEIQTVLICIMQVTMYKHIVRLPIISTVVNGGQNNTEQYHALILTLSI